ncbi:DegT/DnrJ/EryC1/StrS family aminotransferase [Halogeometricum luteum]|uniref:DegT/DnrJ/EryC1/StrS family aminotransferase n=1 Tax=Halogeometricum luteum TaxID=2950537 RepID=UPI00287B7734|nr:DegT/DnrJ/EryC1/StrS family aminotransferase [Halogeometricum sp. S3BR5-2]
MSDHVDVEGSVPFASPDIGDREKERVASVLDSGMLASGAEVRRFESEFASYCGVDRGVATSNGTTALHAALRALGIGPGDRVLTTPFSFVATANAVRFCGATPVFADIHPETYNLDPRSVETALREDADGIDAILAVHLYGLPSDVGRLRELADEYEIPLVEDAAQAHGAEYDGERVGRFGDAACFSFYPTKNMTTGEGGMVVTDDENVAERAARFVNHGRDEEGAHAELGHNFRLTNLAAAIGRVQLDKLDGYTEARRRHAATLDAAVADSEPVSPVEPYGRRHVYHQYTVRCPNRSALRTHLESRGIGTGVYYPTPIHREPSFDRADETYPVAERAAEEVLSLPVHPGLTDSETERVANALRDYQ